MFVNGSSMYMGGDFRSVGSKCINWITRWDPQSTIVTSETPSANGYSSLGLGINGLIRSMYVVNDTDLYVGGEFTHAGKKKKKKRHKPIR